MPITLVSSIAAEAGLCSSGNTPMTSAEAAAVQRQRSELVTGDAGVFWLESNPENGLDELWRLNGEQPERVVPGYFGIRSTVNSYGGGALCVANGAVYAVEVASQQIHRIDPATGGTVCLTNCPGASFGGLVADPFRHRILAVRETGHGQSLVAVTDRGQLSVLHAGEDFYGAPALSASGRRIAWISWRLPDMPWVATSLWTARLDQDGQIHNDRSWQPPVTASVQQPCFDGEQVVVLSDHEGWWQPYRHSVVDPGSDGLWQALGRSGCDYANAPWQLAENHHCPLPGGGWARVRYVQGVGQLILSGTRGRQVRLAPEFSDFRSLHLAGETLYCIARAPDRLDAVLAIEPASERVAVVAGGERPMGQRPVALPEVFVLPVAAGASVGVSGFLYRPPGAQSPGPPPLILIAHGGPTSAAYPVFDAQTQYWCSHGFAVAAVNYRGSTGFGRAYRMALAGQWGEADVEDMVRARAFLVGAGQADAGRCFIQGRSSGGFTALMAMVRGEEFRAGASLFGVSDPARLRAQTHRFESGYLDWLLGAPDSCPDVWQARTPVLQAQHIRKPMIFFQGGQDQVVVPSQTRAIAAAMTEAGNPPELHWFDDEGHGFRQAANLAAMLEYLRAFYLRQSRSAG